MSQHPPFLLSNPRAVGTDPKLFPTARLIFSELRWHVMQHRFLKIAEKGRFLGVYMKLPEFLWNAVSVEFGSTREYLISC
jgi:hypothetical protein